MPAARNLYDILNVSHEAEAVVIEAAYRALMKKYHPDQGGVAAADAPCAVDINRAFSILRDPERRTQYDHFEWARQQQMHLAQYPPELPRAPRVFGWGGWVVALLLAAVILLMARDRTDFAHVAAPAPDLASPAHAETLAGEGTKKMPSFLASGAPEREVDFLRRTQVASAKAEATEAEAHAFVQKARPSPPRRHKQRQVRRRASTEQARREKDFLERQGYIY